MDGWMDGTGGLRLSPFLVDINWSFPSIIHRPCRLQIQITPMDTLGKKYNPGRMGVHTIRELQKYPQHQGYNHDTLKY